MTKDMTRLPMPVTRETTPTELVTVVMRTEQPSKRKESSHGRDQGHHTLHYTRDEGRDGQNSTIFLATSEDGNEDARRKIPCIHHGHGKEETRLQCWSCPLVTGVTKRHGPVASVIELLLAALSLVMGVISDQGLITLIFTPVITSL